jgi:Zn finger protein HypA/HybF involved in hydrogenase expression
MTHYRLRESDPSAIVLAQNPRTGSYEESKIYSNASSKEVYLQDKQNFSLHFFNPLQEKIGARISFNGQDSPHLLVLNPGQDVTLERFLGENRKMVFETYTVDAKNPQVEQAIANNGIVKIEFFKEKRRRAVVNTCYSEPRYKSSTRNYCSSKGISPDEQFSCSSQNISASLNPDQTLGFMDLDCDFESNSRGIGNVVEEKLETGRIEMGDVSNQNLEHVNVDFESYAFLTLEYKLLPASQINRDSKEIRNYCPKCRFRIRKESWVYCPQCGERL